MQFTIDIDDKLLAEAKALSNAQTTDETVKQALKLMVHMYNQQNIKNSRDKVLMSDKR